MPALPHSRELVQQATLRRALVLYRMVFGQNRQEDLVHYLLAKLPPDEVERIIGMCRIDLSPPKVARPTAVFPAEVEEISIPSAPVAAVGCDPTPPPVEPALPSNGHVQALLDASATWLPLQRSLPPPL